MFKIDEYSNYKSEASSAICIKLVTSFEEVSFHPEYTHQLFGENESIFGYINPTINLQFCGKCFQSYLDFKYDQKFLSKCGIEADNVTDKFKDKLSDVILTERDFKLHVLKCKIAPFGKCIASFTSKNQDYSIYMVQAADFSQAINGLDFKTFYERLQIFPLFYIDAASYIDLEDEKWRIFLLYKCHKISNNCYNMNAKKIKTNSEPPKLFDYNDSTTQRSDDSTFLLGFANVYEYYAFPDKIRPRISQFILMPPFQRNSLGSKLLSAIYRFYRPLPTTNHPNSEIDLFEIPIATSDIKLKVEDITVETPAPEFSLMRDFVDCRDSLWYISQPMIKEQLSTSFIHKNSTLIKIGTDPVILACLHKNLKINKKQLLKVIDILNLYLIQSKTNNEKASQLNTYEKEFKAKLIKTMKKENEKLAKHNATIITQVEIIDKADNIYKETIEVYNKIINKLTKCKQI